MIEDIELHDGNDRLPLPFAKVLDLELRIVALEGRVTTLERERDEAKAAAAKAMEAMPAPMRKMLAKVMGNGGESDG